jgi:hypothetical protein
MLIAGGFYYFAGGFRFIFSAIGNKKRQQKYSVFNGCCQILPHTFNRINTHILSPLTEKRLPFYEIQTTSKPETKKTIGIIFAYIIRMLQKT